MSAIAKLMCISGHNAYLSCRFCYLKEVYSDKSRHVYFPCSMPRSSGISDFNPKDLLIRNEHDFFSDVDKIMNETNNTRRTSYIKETGINNFI